MTNTIINIIKDIANRHDALIAGQMIYNLSVPNPCPTRVKELRDSIASTVLEEDGWVPSSVLISDDDRIQLRAWIRETTGHRWHHSCLPHRLVKIGRAARALQG